MGSEILIFPVQLTPSRVGILHVITIVCSVQYPLN